MEGKNQIADGQHDNEISLVDLWLVIVRRKWVVIIIFFSFFIAGLIYATTKPVRYQYTTCVDLARLPGRDRLTSTYELMIPKKNSIDSLKYVNLPQEREVLFGEGARDPIKVEVEDLKDTYSLIMKTTVPPEKADDVKKLHRAAALALAKEQDKVLQKILSAEINPLKARARVLDEQIKNIESELKTLSQEMKGASGTKALIYSQQISGLRNELAQARLDLVQAESSAQSISDSTQGMTISYLAVRSKSPVGPGTFMLVALSCLIGGMIGVFSAFFVEFFQKANQAGRQ